MRIRILPILITVLIAGLAFIFVQQVLAAPVLTNNGITVDEGSIDNIIFNSDLQASDSMSTTATFTYTILTPTQRGTLSGGGSFTQDYIDDGSLKYTHNGSETITDSFRFNVTNGVTIFITGTFNITVTPVNDAPNAVSDEITVTEGGTVTTLSDPPGATSVIFNDTDAENDTLTVNSHTPPSQASAFTLNTDGTFSYTHNGSEDHSDSFTYTVCDDGTPQECDTTTVSITITPVNDPPSLTISGTPTENQTLTANLSDGDGLPAPASISYQWQRSINGTSGWTNIGGGTNTTYTPDDAVVGEFIRVTASYTDTQNTPEEPESNSVGPIANINDTPSLTITGAPTENVTLTAILMDGDGLPGTVNYQWERSETGSEPWVDIDGATSSTYTLDDIDVGDHIRVTATYTDDHGTAESPVSTSIGPVANVNDIPSFTLNGTQTEDQTLTAVLTDGDGYDTGSVTYQWERSNDGVNGWADIDGETDSTYTLGDDDAGKYVRVTATYIDDHGTAESPTATSGLIVNINDAPSLIISGTQTEDETLTAILSDNDGLPLPGAITYQWHRSADGNSPWSPISGATSSSYTLGDLDAYNFVRVRATYTDQQGTAESPTAATGEIVNVNDTPIAVNDSFSVAEGQSNSINVITHQTPPSNLHDDDVDLFDTLSTSIVTAPAHASTYSLSPSGVLQYTHNGSETTSDTIEYEVCDNGSPVKCAPAFVTITILPVDDPPTAVPDTYNLLEGATVTGNVKTNDFDAENHSFIVITPVISPPSYAAQGGFSLQNNGAFTYKHDGSENHSDSFRYRVCDADPKLPQPIPLERCSETTVTLVITPVNDAPTTSPDTFTVPRSETLDTQAEPGQTTVLANDTDPEGNTMTVNATPVIPPIYAASFTLNANGSFIYVHDDSSNLPDSFTYRVCDNGTPSKCSEETVTINIGPRPTTFIYLPTILNNYSPDEPNNSPCTAYPISLNSQNNFTPNDIEDWYRITLPSPRNLNVQLSNFLLQGDLIVYRSSDCVIDGSDEVKNDGTSQSSKSVNWGIAPAGTYYIRVYTANPNPNAQSYSLIVNAP